MGRVSFKSFAVWFLSGLAAIFILHRLGSETVTRDAVTFESKHAGKFSWSQVHNALVQYLNTIKRGDTLDRAKVDSPLDQLRPCGRRQFRMCAFTGELQ